MAARNGECDHGIRAVITTREDGWIEERASPNCTVCVPNVLIQQYKGFQRMPLVPAEGIVKMELGAGEAVIPTNDLAELAAIIAERDKLREIVVFEETAKTQYLAERNSIEAERQTLMKANHKLEKELTQKQKLLDDMGETITKLKQEVVKEKNEHEATRQVYNFLTEEAQQLLANMPEFDEKGRLIERALRALMRLKIQSVALLNERDGLGVLIKNRDAQIGDLQKIDGEQRKELATLHEHAAENLSRLAYVKDALEELMIFPEDMPAYMRLAGAQQALRNALKGMEAFLPPLRENKKPEIAFTSPAAEVGAVLFEKKAPPETVLEEASRITSADHQKQYGPPEDSFGLIATLWSEYLSTAFHGTGMSFKIGPRDVAMLMILMKVARDARGQKRDNLVDICGYARCAEMIESKK